MQLTDRYLAFLEEADPVDVETITPSEQIRFIPAADLVAEQLGYSVGDAETPARKGWRPSWVVIAHSTLLGDPYFLDTSRSDVEGDCPVMTTMSGTEQLKPVLCASSFACFLRILTAAMKVATGFGEDTFDDQDDAIFREALSPKIRVIDSAALRSGHWT
ncbi:MAG: SMI1/KNR4 family protein [Deltaproteobacteria bacterium]|nr:SMI1/KNR4 family protein [Deltaproteobacteria bacterium]MBW2535773.1 SMI1/KNR4 family protein [Deltaproteobacteria bacterium]